jgi:pantoate--beta-alanine ligase
MNLEVVACPTIREPDGLAMSSRNTYLSAEQRKAAPVLYNSLQLARQLWAEGERDAGVIKRKMTEIITTEPIANIVYISIANAATLKEFLHNARAPALVSIAVKYGKTRLIDNIILE